MKSNKSLMSLFFWGKALNSTLRFRKARNYADHQGQVFTPPAIASLLAESLPTHCDSIIDVGAGTGALASAALKRCPEANVYLIEKDALYAEQLATNFERTRVVTRDALIPGLLEGLLKTGHKNVILSNPPYGMEKLRNLPESESSHNSIIPSIHGGWVRRDAAFVCRIWNSSTKGDTIGLIVTLPIISSADYSELRRRLVQELSGLVVTELHPKTFNNAEVQAYLITGYRSLKRSRNVLLRQANIDGEISRELVVSNEQALQRLDFTYHSNVNDLKLKPEQVLGGLAEVGAVIRRGSRSQNKYRELGFQAFHTTDFALNTKDLTLDGAVEGYNSARSGDILIPRVGTRCLIREAKVVRGVGLITDCIYRIRAPLQVQQKIWNTLNSDFGREWRRLAAKGSCAKYITISSLEAMPVLI